MSKPPPDPPHYQPPPVQQVHVSMPYVPQSQALPALVSFLLPGVGQLIQGRVIAWLVFSAAWVIGLVSLCIGVGFVIVPLVALIATVEAAIYDPMRPPSMAPMVAMLAVVAIAMLAPIAFVLGLGGLIAATEPVADATRPLETIVVESEPEEVLEPLDTTNVIELPDNIENIESPDPDPLAEFAAPAPRDQTSQPLADNAVPPTETPAPVEPENPKRRTWKSAHGQFSVEADFVSRGGNQVKLRKVDGTEITVQMEQLSDADQEWIRNYRPR